LEQRDLIKSVKNVSLQFPEKMGFTTPPSKFTTFKVCTPTTATGLKISPGP